MDEIIRIIVEILVAIIALLGLVGVVIFFINGKSIIRR
jgi:hypothetical protein